MNPTNVSYILSISSSWSESTIRILVQLPQHHFRQFQRSWHFFLTVSFVKFLFRICKTYLPLNNERGCLLTHLLVDSEHMTWKIFSLLPGLFLSQASRIQFAIDFKVPTDVSWLIIFLLPSSTFSIVRALKGLL